MSLKITLTRWLFQDMPESATWDGWEDWKDKARKNKVRWFLADTIPFWFRTTFIHPVSAAKYWIRYRVFDKYHIIKTGLKPDHYDMDTRLLHGMFNMLVDFVEVEKAWMNVVFTNRRPWTAWGRTRWWRSRKEGLNYLDWEISLSKPHLPEDERNERQAKEAQEIKDLYIWWKDIRPNRLDPSDTSGWSNVCSRWNVMSDKDESEEKRKEIDTALKKLTELEEQYEKEDTEMMKRLIDVRKALWT